MWHVDAVDTCHVDVTAKMASTGADQDIALAATPSHVAYSAQTALYTFSCDDINKSSHIPSPHTRAPPTDEFIYLLHTPAPPIPRGAPLPCLCLGRKQVCAPSPVSLHTVADLIYLMMYTTALI